MSSVICRYIELQSQEEMTIPAIEIVFLIVQKFFMGNKAFCKQFGEGFFLKEI